jgi:hypothetical protein
MFIVSSLAPRATFMHHRYAYYLTLIHLLAIHMLRNLVRLPLLKSEA